MTTDTARRKSELRRRVIAARRALDGPTRARESQAIGAALLAVVDGLARSADDPLTVCAHLPVGSEPGVGESLDALRARGHRVLLPRTGEPGPLDWAEYRGAAHLTTGRFGLAEPDGPPLGPAAIGAADVVVVPAVAVALTGMRLGKGGGYYDRTLPAVNPGTPVLAVIRDPELVDTIPTEAHDAPLDGVVTPSGVRLFGETPDRADRPVR